jgi:hypothetical protein
VEAGDTVWVTVNETYWDSLAVTNETAELFHARFDFADTIWIEPECANGTRLHLNRHFLVDSVAELPDNRRVYVVASAPEPPAGPLVLGLSVMVAEANAPRVVSHFAVAYSVPLGNGRCVSESRIRVLANGVYRTNKITCRQSGSEYPTEPVVQHCTSEARADF